VLDTNVVRSDLAELTRGANTVGRYALAEFSGLYQLTHMANQRGALRKDDRIDVMSNMVAYWLDHMALDSEKAQADEQRKDDEAFARLVLTTQLKGSHFVPEPTGRPRGTGRATRAASLRTPKALKRALQRNRSGTWRR